MKICAEFTRRYAEMTLQLKAIIALLLLAALCATGFYIQALEAQRDRAQESAKSEKARADENADAYVALSASIQRQNAEVRRQHDAFTASQAQLQQAKAVVARIESDADAKIGLINQQLADYRAGAQSGMSDECAAVFKMLDGATR